MRTAAICPTCAVFTNAECALYNGEYLTNSDIDPLDSVTTAIEKFNAAIAPLHGVVAPTISAVYIGQLYVNTTVPTLYFAKSAGLGAADWVAL